MKPHGSKRQTVGIFGVILASALASSASGQVPQVEQAAHNWLPGRFDIQPDEYLYYEASDHCNPHTSILLVHGIASSTQNWAEVRDGLADHGCVISVDLLGFGQSSHTLRADYSIDAQAERLLSFISTRLAPKTVLIGHSYGGAVALLALAKANQRGLRLPISALILVDTPAYPQSVPWFFRMLYTPVLDRIVTLFPPSLLVTYPLRRMFYDRKKINPTITARYVETLKKRHAISTLARSLKFILPANPPEYVASIRGIRLPTLILWGDHDTLVRPSVATRLVQDIPGSSLRFISPCGHIPQEEQPEAFKAAVSAFLREQSALSLVPD